MDSIRNIAIIAHVDHGKTTLVDKIIDQCKVLDERKERTELLLDSNDLERERGITIKLQSVRLDWKDSVINLIDTPGHVDFGYEVSRSLAACEGVILVVDAAQGIEAQTLANCYQALEHDLEIVAVLNKIDLPASEPDRYADEIEKALGIPTDEIFRISAKTGEGVPELLDAVVEKTPSPEANEDLPLQALVFDSHFDQYRGVVSSVRIMQGRLDTGMSIKFMQAGTNHQLDEVGVWRPEMTPVKSLGPGEVGYVLAGIKDVGEARSGETITTTNGGSESALAGYQEPKPMVFSGLYPIDGDDFGDLRDALEKLRLNDSSFTFEPDTSSALGFGFRCGFLGLLHMEIVRERLEREFDLNLITTAPSVKYRVVHASGKVEEIDNPCDLPSAGEISAIEEPWLATTLISPAEYTGTLMELCQGRRGELDKLSYLSPERIELKYRLPLAEVVLNFFDQLKSRTQGYASLDYEPAGYMKSDLVRVDILLQGESVDAFSAVVHRDASYEYGRKMAERLKELIPRQQFEVPIQATIGGRIIARETVRAYRKDVTAKLYGGDITRKRKLLEKQKQGKRKMKSIGRVDVPQEAFVSALSLEE